MKIVKLFKNGKSQAIRLPKGFRFEGQTEVSIRRRGKSVILEPVERFTWESWWNSWKPLGEKFMPRGREQPAVQERVDP